MKTLELTCKGCGAQMKVDESRTKCYCEMCGREELIDDETQKIVFDLSNIEEFGYIQRKGAMRADAEYRASKEEQERLRVKEEKKSKWVGVGSGIGVVSLIYLLDEITAFSKVVHETFTAFGIGTILIAIVLSFITKRIVFFQESILGIKIKWIARTVAVMSILLALLFKTS